MVNIFIKNELNIYIYKLSLIVLFISCANNKKKPRKNSVSKFENIIQESYEEGEQNVGKENVSQLEISTEVPLGNKCNICGEIIKDYRKHGCGRSMQNQTVECDKIFPNGSYHNCKYYFCKICNQKYEEGTDHSCPGGNRCENIKLENSYIKNKHINESYKSFNDTKNKLYKSCNDTIPSSKSFNDTKNELYKSCNDTIPSSKSCNDTIIPSSYKYVSISTCIDCKQRYNTSTEHYCLKTTYNINRESNSNTIENKNCINEECTENSDFINEEYTENRDFVNEEYLENSNCINKECTENSNCINEEYIENTDNQYATVENSQIETLNVSGYTKLQLACKRGDVTELNNALLTESDTINDPSEDENGDSAIHLAVRYNHKSIIKILYENGANINVKNTKGEMPINMSYDSYTIDYSAERLEIFSLLIKYEADVTVLDSSGKNLIHQASKEGSIEILTAIFSREKNKSYINRKTNDSNNVTAVYLASMSKHVNVLDILKENGADLDIEDSEGYTALRKVSECGIEFYNISQKLTDLGAELYRSLSKEIKNMEYDLGKVTNRIEC